MKNNAAVCTNGGTSYDRQYRSYRIFSLGYRVCLCVYVFFTSEKQCQKVHLTFFLCVCVCLKINPQNSSYNSSFWYSDVLIFNFGCNLVYVSY